MRILQVHNKYLHYGGEDAVVDNEYKILVENKIEIEQLIFDNTKINPLKLVNNNLSFDITEKAILRFKPDVMHVHNIFYQASSSVLKAAKKHGVKVVMTLHNFRLLCPGGLFLRNSEVCTKCKNLKFPIHSITHKCFQDSYTKSLALSYLLGFGNSFRIWDKHIDKFIILTPFIKDLISNSSLNIKDEKLVVKPNSTDDFLSGFTSNYDRNGYVFIGRLSKEKGVDTLIKAFGETQLQLHVIGDGELESGLKQNSGSNITFHGIQNRDFIKEKLLRSRALVFPSIWYEGLPNTIIESFSSATPVIASNMDNINTIVKEGYNAELFEVNDYVSLSNRILEFDNMDTSEYHKNARATFEEKYDHRTNYQNLINIYTSLI